MNEEKKVGDWVVVLEGAYQIRNAPDVFLRNEFATEKQIKFAKKLINENN